MTRTRPATLMDSMRDGTIFCISVIEVLARWRGFWTLKSSSRGNERRLGGAYKKARAADEAHEIVALGDPHSFLNGHGRVSVALNYGAGGGGIAFGS